MKTSVTDQESKIDLIEHINQDHTDEVLMIAQVYAGCPTATQASLADVFEEGVDIAVQFDKTNEKTVFAPFQIQGDIEEKLLYSAYSAMAKQGRLLSDNRRQFLSICDTQMLTPNLLRLTISSDAPLPESSPAYAYGFLLKVLEKQPEKKQQTNAKHKGLLQRIADSVLLWVMKQLSSQRRQKMIKSMNKGIRYYTLQRSWSSDPTRDFADHGYIDIYLHGDTAGSLWAKSLKIGDVITSRVEHEDHHDNLQTGTALLIADETAYPALLGLLQQWQNPIAPVVIILSNKATEQDYFSDSDLQPVAQTQRIVCSPSEQGERVIEALNELPTFTTAWGAFEKESAKMVRMHLRNHYQINGQDNRIKGYWTLGKL